MSWTFVLNSTFPLSCTAYDLYYLHCSLSKQKTQKINSHFTNNITHRYNSQGDNEQAQFVLFVTAETLIQLKITMKLRENSRLRWKWYRFCRTQMVRRGSSDPTRSVTKLNVSTASRQHILLWVTWQTANFSPVARAHPDPLPGSEEGILKG